MSKGTRFGGELRRLREGAGKTLKDVAELWGGLSIPYVSDVERGRRHPPSGVKIRALADFLGVPDQADRLVALSVLERGEISMEPRDQEQRELLVSLNRTIEENTLDPDTIKQILQVLRSRARPDE